MHLPLAGDHQLLALALRLQDRASASSNLVSSSGQQAKHLRQIALLRFTAHLDQAKEKQMSLASWALSCALSPFKRRKVGLLLVQSAAADTLVGLSSHCTPQVEQTLRAECSTEPASAPVCQALPEEVSSTSLTGLAAQLDLTRTLLVGLARHLVAPLV